MLIFAHRGASVDAPENTLKAFELAIEQGADGIEFDLIQVANEFYVFHDRWLHRTTDGNGLIQSRTQSYLSSLNAGLGQRIPTLYEALSCINGRCMVNIELKSITDVAIFCDKLLQCSSHFDLSQLIVSSFNHPYLIELKSYLPALKIAFVMANYPIDGLKEYAQAQAWSVHQDIQMLDEGFIADAHQLGLKVFIYTVDEILDWKTLQALNIDGVFTNTPSSCKRILQSRHVNIAT